MGEKADWSWLGEGEREEDGERSRGEEDVAAVRASVCISTDLVRFMSRGGGRGSSRSRNILGKEGSEAKKGRRCSKSPEAISACEGGGPGAGKVEPTKGPAPKPVKPSEAVEEEGDEEEEEEGDDDEGGDTSLRAAKSESDDLAIDLL